MGRRRIPHMIVVIFALRFSAVVGGSDTQTPAKLSPEQLGEDTAFLFEQLETVHPDTLAHASEQRYAKIQSYLREQCRQPLTLQEFYDKIRVALDHLEEGHTFVHPPLASTPRQQRESARAQLDRALATDSVSRNSYALLQNPQVCILRYSACGLPRELPQYEAFFARMFAEMRSKGTRGLIVDVRGNGGGFSGTNEALIRHFARAPFRQFEKIRKRLTPQALAFCRSIGVDYGAYLKQAYDTSALSFDPNALPEKGEFTAPARFIEPVEGPLRFTGPVSVLVDRGTYSSAQFFASTVQHYGLATLIGEETLPFALGRQHYGDVVFISLPHSQLTVQISTAILTITAAGDKGVTRVVPDYKVAQKKSDTEKNVDTVMSFALNMLKKRVQKSGRRDDAGAKSRSTPRSKKPITAQNSGNS